MDTRKKIISVAIKVFADKGEHGARMEEIAKKAKVNKAMLYYYYTSKELLFKEVIKSLLQDVFEDIKMQMDKVFTKSGSHIEKIQAFIKAHHTALSKNINYTKLIINVLTNESGEGREIMRLSKENIVSEIPQKMIEIIEDGIKKGVFRKVNPKQVIISIIGANLITFMGSHIAEVMLDFKVKDTKVFLKEREKSNVDLLLKGISA